MATKVCLKHGSRFLGQVTIFDADPSFALLIIAFPEARGFLWSSRTNQFTVDVGDEPVSAYAE